MQLGARLARPPPRRPSPGVWQAPPPPPPRARLVPPPPRRPSHRAWKARGRRNAPLPLASRFAGSAATSPPRLTLGWRRRHLAVSPLAFGSAPVRIPGALVTPIAAAACVEQRRTERPPPHRPPLSHPTPPRPPLPPPPRLRLPARSRPPPLLSRFGLAAAPAHAAAVCVVHASLSWQRASTSATLGSALRPRLAQVIPRHPPPRQPLARAAAHAPSIPAGTSAVAVVAPLLAGTAYVRSTASPQQTPPLARGARAPPSPAAHPPPLARVRRALPRHRPCHRLLPRLRRRRSCGAAVR